MTRDNIIAYDSDTEGWEWGKSVQRILIEVVKTSLERGADIFAKDNAERTVLDFAMAYDESKIIPTLGDQSGFRLQVWVTIDSIACYIDAMCSHSSNYYREYGSNIIPTCYSRSFISVAFYIFLSLNLLMIASTTVMPWPNFVWEPIA
jgi:hypothetical protein